MVSKKYTTLRWIYVWWGLTILFSSIEIFISSPWAFPTFILIVVTSALTIFSFLRGIYIHRREQKALKELFEVYYELIPDQEQPSLTVGASPNPQDVKITLRMKASVTLQYIALGFEGEGTKPDIKELYDHQLNIAHIGVRYIKYLDGGRNLTFEEHKVRTPRQRIRIGMKCVILPFCGKLKVELKSEEGDGRAIYLPFIGEKDESNKETI